MLASVEVEKERREDEDCGDAEVDGRGPTGDLEVTRRNGEGERRERRFTLGEQATEKLRGEDERSEEDEERDQMEGKRRVPECTVLGVENRRREWPEEARRVAGIRPPRIDAAVPPEAVRLDLAGTERVDVEGVVRRAGHLAGDAERLKLVVEGERREQSR